MNTLQKIVKLLRPAQQLKTGAVILGALASGKVDSVDSVFRLFTLTILWIGLSGSVYIVNEFDGNKFTGLNVSSCNDFTVATESYPLF